MGATANAIVCLALTSLYITEHTKNIRKIASPSVCHIYLRYLNNILVHLRNDCQNAHSRHLEGKYTTYILFA